MPRIYPGGGRLEDCNNSGPGTTGVSESEREAEDALTLDDTNITTDAVDSAVGTKVVVAVGSNAEGTSKDNTNDIRSSYFVGENFLFDRRRLADQYNEESLDPSYTPITD